jgi:chromate transporter
VITFALGRAYVQYGRLPAAGWLFYGIKPAVLAVVFQALCELWPKAAKSTTLAAIGVLAVVAAFGGVHEIPIIFLGGALAVFFQPRSPGSGAKRRSPTA